MSKNRIELVITYIKSHPEKSGNQIYIYSKAHGFGINKQKFYQIYREEKIQPTIIKKIVKKKVKTKKVIKKIKITVQKKLPVKVKYKNLHEKDKILSRKLTGLIEYPEDPNLEYGLIEVYDKVKKESYWIKYHDKAHLDWQIDKLEASDKKKGFSPDFDFIVHGLQTYTPFISPEFAKIMEEIGEGD